MSLERLFRTPSAVRYAPETPRVATRTTLNQVKNTLNRITHSHRELENLYDQSRRVQVARNKFIAKMYRVKTMVKYQKALVGYLRLEKIYMGILKRIKEMHLHQQKIIRRLTSGQKLANFINMGTLTNQERILIARIMSMVKNIGVAKRTLSRTSLPNNIQYAVRSGLRNSYVRNIAAV